MSTYQGTKEYKEEMAECRAEKIKAGAMQIAAGDVSRECGSLPDAEMVAWAIGLATLIIDFPIPEQED